MYVYKHLRWISMCEFTHRVPGLWSEMNNFNETAMHALFPSEATSGNVKTIMKRHFKEWWSTIPSISTKLTTTWNYWTERKPRYMTLEINVLARDRQIQWRGLINLSMRCQPYPLDNWMSNVNIDIIVCYVSHYMLFGTCMSKFCLFTFFYWKCYQWAKNYGIDLLIATRLNDICMNGYFYIETSTCVLK